MTRSIDDVDFFPQNLVNFFYNFKIILISPLFLTLTYVIKDLLLISLGLLIVVPLLFFELLIGSFLLFYSYSLNKRAKKLDSLPVSAISQVFVWLFKKERRKEVRIIHISLFLLLLDILYLNLYQNSLAKNIYESLNFLLILAIIIETDFFIFMCMITIVSLYKNDIK